MEINYQAIIRQAYNSFNKRDIDAILLLMTKDVHWPNGWEGGYVKGHEEVRDYWTRQWKELDPVVTPVSIIETGDETVDVAVHQLVKDSQANILFDGIIHHIYSFNNGKIKSMEIEAAK